MMIKWNGDANLLKWHVKYKIFSADLKTIPAILI